MPWWKQGFVIWITANLSHLIWKNMHKIDCSQTSFQSTDDSCCYRSNTSCKFNAVSVIFYGFVLVSLLHEEGGYGLKLLLPWQGLFLLPNEKNWIKWSRRCQRFQQWKHSEVKDGSIYSKVKEAAKTIGLNSGKKLPPWMFWCTEGNTHLLMCRKAHLQVLLIAWEQSLFLCSVD